jgi:hypothetical protein
MKDKKRARMLSLEQENSILNHLFKTRYPMRDRVMGFFAYPPKGYISAIRPANCDDSLNITY